MLSWLFGKRETVDSLEALSLFCDRQAAFNCQKNIFEFVRARASTNTESLFEEAAFKDSMERARWQGYPIALTNMLEMVSTVLRTGMAGAPEVDRIALDTTQRIARQLMDGYNTKQPFLAGEWEGLTGKILTALSHSAALPVKPVKDIPLARSQAFFDLIPLHPDIKGPDFKSIENHMRVNLCRAHDELLRRLDLPRLEAALAGAGHVAAAKVVSA